MSVASFFLENLARQLHPRSLSMLNLRKGTTKKKQPFPIQTMEVKHVEKRYPHFKNRASGWIKGLPTPGDKTEYLPNPEFRFLLSS